MRLRMSPDELSRIRWKGDGAFRALSYYFTVRWNRVRLGESIRIVLEPFAVAPEPDRNRNPPTPGLPPAYALIDLGSGQEGRYRVLYGEDVLLSTDDRENALHHLFWHINVETCWQTGDFLLIHSGAVVTPAGGGALLPGQSGSGKTTLTAGLVRAGFGYLSDEAGAIDPVSRRLYPYAKTLSIKEGAFGLFPELDEKDGRLRLVQGAWHVPPDSVRPGATAGPCNVRYVIAPRYRTGSETVLTPISRAETVAVLWDNLWNLSPYRGRALRILTDVMLGARGFRLEYQDLHEAVRTVMRATAPGKLHARSSIGT